MKTTTFKREWIIENKMITTVRAGNLKNEIIDCPFCKGPLITFIKKNEHGYVDKAKPLVHCEHFLEYGMWQIEGDAEYAEETNIDIIFEQRRQAYE